MTAETPARQGRKGADTRGRILDRAARVFSVRGYAGTSISDVMRATGLEKGGIYNHFASKDALAVAAFDHAVALLWARLDAARAAAPEAEGIGELHALLNAYRSFAARPVLPGGCPLLNTAVEADDTHPALRARVRAALGDLRGRITGAVARGIAAGNVRPEVDGEALATVALAALEGAVMLSKLDRDPAHMLRVADFLAAHIETSVRLHP